MQFGERLFLQLRLTLYIVCQVANGEEVIIARSQKKEANSGPALGRKQPEELLPRRQAEWIDVRAAGQPAVKDIS